MNSPTKSRSPASVENQRKSASNLIQCYYFQLKDGCGSNSCTNEHCASSGKVQNLLPNEAAAQALHLFKERATLCKNIQNKNSEFFAKSSNNCDTSDTKPVVEEPMDVSNESAAKPSTSSLDLTAFTTSESSRTPVEPKDYLNEKKLMKIIEECNNSNSYSLLIRKLGSIFSNEECLKMSFLKELPTSENLSKEDIRSMEIDEDKDQDSKDFPKESYLLDISFSDSEEVFQPPRILVSTKWQNVTVDIESVRRCFKALFSIPQYPFQTALINALIILSETIEIDLRYRSPKKIDEHFINIFLIIMEIPMLECPEYLESALPSFCRAASLLPVAAQATLCKIWAREKPNQLKDKVHLLHHLITLRVIAGNFNREYYVNDDDIIVAATKVMKILYFANIYGGDMDEDACEDLETNADSEAIDESLQDLLQSSRESKEQKTQKEDVLAQELGIKILNCRKPVIPFEDFLNEPLSDQIEMDKDFACYKSEGPNFSFMNYSFILTPAVKSLGLYYDNRIRMYSERRFSVLQSLVQGANLNPYLKLRVRRDHLIDDALVGLEMVALENPTNLKKQLVVEFEGEQGIDEGGVSKEFFQLVVEEIFNPDFAMFTLNQDTQTYWFNPTSFESDAQFTLIGIILGLAIYNNVILDVHFPMVVYQKLMGKKGTLNDLKQSNPQIGKSLQDLLDYEEDDIEAIYLQTFRISYQDIFGTVLTHDLKYKGDELLVNQLNKDEFVDLYTDFLMNKSIEKQFKAFRRGFLMVTDDSPLRKLFRPEEIELLVCGSKNFDFNALEDSAEYDGGYTSESKIIRHFWELVHEFTIEQKRKLLQFASGSDRVPVGGLSKLKLVIARHGPDSNRLPTAHTCFNVLLLPEYSTKEKLQERLLKAINYSKGFGML